MRPPNALHRKNSGRRASNLLAHAINRVIASKRVLIVGTIVRPYRREKGAA